MLSEIWKQLYLYFRVYGGSYYNVWYFPFQLCSMPMYFCLLYGFLPPEAKLDSIKKAIIGFTRDFGMLGGIMALIVHQGFTDTGYVLLSIHGYLWHIMLILISLYITKERLADFGRACFINESIVFLSCAGIASLINCLLHSYGDCDMFYITFFHLSSQLVFSDIDRLVGRPLGIVFYLFSAVLGALLIHFSLMRLLHADKDKSKSII